MRRPSIFKKTDVTRAARGVLAAGVPIDRVEVGKDGRIIIVASKPDEPIVDGCEKNPWDTVLRHAANEERSA